jgi:hypothetical protein
MDEPIVFDRLRQQGICQFLRRPPAERTQFELVLTLCSMPLTVPLHREISVNCLWKDTDLIGDEFEQRDRWPLAGAQCTARVAQVACESANRIGGGSRACTRVMRKFTE